MKPKKSDIPHALLAVVLTKGLPKPEPLEAGTHTLRGRASIDVDCFVTKLPKGEQAKPWPSREILALALGQACNNDPAKLMECLSLAARRLLQDGDEIPVELEVAMETVKARHKDEVEQVPREGATTVTGTVEVRGFEAKG